MLFGLNLSELELILIIGNGSKEKAIHILRRFYKLLSPSDPAHRSASPGHRIRSATAEPPQPLGSPSAAENRFSGNFLFYCDDKSTPQSPVIRITAAEYTPA